MPVLHVLIIIIIIVIECKVTRSCYDSKETF